jgi:hypothetical protein
MAPKWACRFKASGKSHLNASPTIRERFSLDVPYDKKYTTTFPGIVRANKKSLFPQRETGFFSDKVKSRKALFLRQHGYPDVFKTGPYGFAPSGYPEFTFSETSYCEMSKSVKSILILYLISDVVKFYCSGVVNK